MSTMQKDKGKIEWEMFYDPGYFGMHAVRPVGDRSLYSPRLFHFPTHDQASAFLELVRKASVSLPVIDEDE